MNANYDEKLSLKKGILKSTISFSTPLNHSKKERVLSAIIEIEVTPKDIISR